MVQGGELEVPLAGERPSAHPTTSVALVTGADL
jgi:hypothetical protein